MDVVVHHHPRRKIVALPLEVPKTRCHADPFTRSEFALLSDEAPGHEVPRVRHPPMWELSSPAIDGSEEHGRNVAPDPRITVTQNTRAVSLERAPNSAGSHVTHP